MNIPWGIKLLFIVTFLMIFWVMIDSMIWGFLIFIAALSILTALASTIDKTSQRKVGSRLLIYFLNNSLLLEVLGFALGLIAGGTGTISGIKYAITAGLFATAFRWMNGLWKDWQNITLVELVYDNNLPNEWKAGESISDILRKPRTK